MEMSPTCPGCLVTSSLDSTIKVWDIENDKPTFIEEVQSKVGLVYTLSTCPNEPFVFCMGGDNRENNMEVLDFRHLDNGMFS